MGWCCRERFRRCAGCGCGGGGCWHWRLGPGTGVGTALGGGRVEEGARGTRHLYGVPVVALDELGTVCLAGQKR